MNESCSNSVLRLFHRYFTIVLFVIGIGKKSADLPVVRESESRATQLALLCERILQRLNLGQNLLFVFEVESESELSEIRPDA